MDRLELFQGWCAEVMRCAERADQEARAAAWPEATLSERDAEMPTGKAPLALFRHAPNVAPPQAEPGTVTVKMLQGNRFRRR